MPKEIVRRSSPNEDFEIEVGWSQDRDVQLGIVGVRGKSLNWLLHGPGDSEDHKNEMLSTLAVAFLGCLVEVKVTDPREVIKNGQVYNQASLIGIGESILNALDVHGNYRGIYSHPDREGINELIRYLRRARDSAYGRDE